MYVRHSLFYPSATYITPFPMEVDSMRREKEGFSAILPTGGKGRKRKSLPCTMPNALLNYQCLEPLRKDSYVAVVIGKVMVIMTPSYGLKWEVGIEFGSSELNKAALLWAHEFPFTGLPSGTLLTLWHSLEDMEMSASSLRSLFLTQISFYFQSS